VTEIPEHLRKRAEEARKKAEAAAGGSGDAPADAPAGATGGEAAAPSAAESRIPAHLLERSKAAKTRSEGGAEAEAGGGTAVATAPPAGAVATATAGPPLAAGPGGHTQRLLTVVKSGSIQDVKAAPVDKVHVWPHLLLVEFVSLLACSAFLLVFSIVVNAPLLTLANINQTPNPSKAPWYFLGLQELLTMFHPMVAGVTIPGIGLFALILAPYTDRNPSNRPEDRKFAISLQTVHLMFWTVLVIIGVFFRGPGFNFTFPWREGLFFDL
jgi:menaquinol-cytochrome c reductase cytochrome b/c subunit